MANVYRLISSNRTLVAAMANAHILVSSNRTLVAANSMKFIATVVLSGSAQLPSSVVDGDVVHEVHHRF